MLTHSAGRKLASLTALAALALAPVPALAGDHDDDDLVGDLSDPQRQEAIGNAVAGMMAVLLNMRTDPLARAMERMGDHRAARKLPPGTTVGDLAGPEARRVPAEVRRRVPAMMGAMGELAGMMQDIAPELEAIGDDFNRQMDEAAHAH